MYLCVGYIQFEWIIFNRLQTVDENSRKHKPKSAKYLTLAFSLKPHAQKHVTVSMTISCKDSPDLASVPALI